MSSECIFCKIAEGKIPSSKVFENDNVLGFVDLHPQAKIHLLFIHKNHSVDINDMAKNPINLAEVFQGIAEYTQSSGLDKSGFRVVTNLGKEAGQSVFHTHFHVVGGEHLGRFGR
jgi:histidine triad (HIT) family protein